MPEVKREEKTQWMTEEALAMVRDGQETKVLKTRVRILNAVFQWLSRRDKNYYTSKCKETKENNKKGKTKDLYLKIHEIKGKFKPRLEMLNDQQGSILSDQEKIKRRWKL